MPRPRKKRADSATAAVNAAAEAALGPLVPPAHVLLPAGAVPFWTAIVANRVRHLWNDADLAQAAVMARAQFDTERLLREIEAEGDVIDGRTNPKHKLAETLARRATSLARVLHVHAEATTGRSDTQGKQLELQRGAVAVADRQDTLIPRLRVVQ